MGEKQKGNKLKERKSGKEKAMEREREGIGGTREIGKGKSYYIWES